MNNIEHLEEYHRLLNRKDLLPGIYLRRNHKFHPLVSCINHIIALYMSENYGEIPIMIDRAHKILSTCSDEEKLQEYMKKALEYLSLMAKYAYSLDLSDGQKGLLPPSLLS